MKSYYNCNAFEDEVFEVKPEISVLQSELILKKLNKNNSASFAKEEVEYKCKWKKQDGFDPKKPTIIISIHNYSELLKKTIHNIESNNINSHCNLIIVDDRSTENIKSISERHSYLRIDNQKGFNFSMLNNIAALIVHKLGGTEVVFWSSDVYCVNETHFLTFLNKHRENNSAISGTKLVYPPSGISYTQEDDSLNINNNFPGMKGKWRNTVQYGSTVWVPVNNRIIPHHYRRFTAINDPKVNCDKGTNCLTGAILIINLKEYIKFGGLNPSLSKNYQDVDLCLKATEQNINCMYFGKDIYFYHDESLTISDKKQDKQMKSDTILFYKIWEKRILGLIT